MKGYRKILIAMNGSEEVLEQGLRLAKDEKCWVTVLKVLPPLEGDLDLTGIRNIGDVLDSGAGKEFSRILEIATSGGALIKSRVEEGDVHEKIVETAEEEGCDLIIMGSEKAGWIRKLIGKNVVERVIRRAPCPVLVVNA